MRSPRSTSRNCGTSSRNWRSRSSVQTRSTSSSSNGPRRSAMAAAVRRTTARRPAAGTGTSVLPKSRVIASIRGAGARVVRHGASRASRARAISTATGLRSTRSQRRPSARRGDAGRAAARVRIEDEVPRPARRRHDALEQPDRLLGRVAGALGRSRRDDRHPPHVGRQLAARRLVRADEPRREVRHAIDRVALEHPVVALRVPQDRVVLARPAIARPPAVVVGPHELVQEAVRRRRPRRAAAARGARSASRRGGTASRGPPGRGGPRPDGRGAPRGATSSGRSSDHAMSDTTS